MTARVSVWVYVSLVWECAAALLATCCQRRSELLLMQFCPPSCRWWTGSCRPQGGRPWWRASATGLGRGSEYWSVRSWPYSRWRGSLSQFFFPYGWLSCTFGHILTAQEGQALISLKPQNIESKSLTWTDVCWHSESWAQKHWKHVWYHHITFYYI